MFATDVCVLCLLKNLCRLFEERSHRGYGADAAYPCPTFGHGIFHLSGHVLQRRHERQMFLELRYIGC